MSALNEYRNRVLRAGSSKTIWRIVAAIVVALIVGGALYAYSHSHNDTSPAVTSAAPAPRP